jgi:hypothetical protein
MAERYGLMRSTANPQRSAILVVLAVALGSALAGCYTVLKHPPTAEVLDGGEARRDCFDCHGAGGPAHAYDPMFTYGFDYLDDDWYPWYAYPWWYRDYWYWDRYEHGHDGGSGGNSGGGSVAGDDDPSRRHLWGRGTVWSPPSMPAQNSGPAAPPASGTTQPASQPNKDETGRTMKSNDSGSGGSTGTSGQSKSDDGKKDTKDKDSDRNVWKRGGSKGGG